MRGFSRKPKPFRCPDCGANCFDLIPRAAWFGAPATYKILCPNGHELVLSVSRGPTGAGHAQPG